MQPPIPHLFKERYAPLADDPDAFLASLQAPLPKSFRVNTLKAGTQEVMDRFSGYGIPLLRTPWYADAFVSSSLHIGKTIEHFLGWIYVQELTSMLPPLLVREELASAAAGGLVLDTCAAPGSKTTQLAALMGNRGTIVANDIDYGRIRALTFNLEKAGALNVAVTNQDIRFFPQQQAYDVILLDAPCSSEGTARKNPAALAFWDERKIISHANLQKQLILKAFDLLQPGGLLVYSTCTFAPEENEAVVDFLLQRRNAALEQIRIPSMKTGSGIEEWNKIKLNQEVKKTARIWPHHNDTGGFYLAKVRK